MSYILDALERSEQERKQSELPSFRQNQSLLYLSKRKRFPWTAALIIVLLINAIVLLYIHFTESENDPGKESRAVASLQESILPELTLESSETATSNLNPSPLQNQSVSTDSVSSSSEPEPTLQIESREAARLSEPSVLTQPRLVDQAARESTLNALEVRSEPASAVVSDQTEAASVTSDLNPVHGNEKEIVDPKPELSEQHEILHPRVVVSKEPLIIEPEVDPFAETAYLHELSGSMRPRVPKLIFNSHIYSTDPTARRVMINNIYLREGQAFEGMILLAISQDYIVFEKSGQRFKVAAMRDWLG